MKRSVLRSENQTLRILRKLKIAIRYKEVYAPTSYSAAKEYNSSRTGAS